jgi:ketosteroid isomerase-like protein
MSIDADRRPDCRVIELFWQWRLQMGSDERAIREVHTTWIDAVNAGDLVRDEKIQIDDMGTIATVVWTRDGSKF